MTAEEMRAVARVMAEVVDRRVHPLEQRIDHLEQESGVHDRYERIRQHRLFSVVSEAITRGEWVPWEWAETLGVSEPELLALLHEWKPGMMA